MFILRSHYKSFSIARRCSSQLYISSTRLLHQKMRLVQFQSDSQKRGVGVQLEGGDVVDLAAADSNIPSDMVSFLEGGQSMLDAATRVVKSGDHVLPSSKVKLLAPITRPDKVLCVGNNYRDHCAEQGIAVPKEPVIFNKFPSTIIGPDDPIPYPKETKELDWEVELAIVIGKKGKNIQKSDAMDHVAGYTVSHDVSARDLQLKPGFNGGQWIIGKSMEGFSPLGPAIVTKDCLDAHNLGLKTRVNGEIKQDSRTDQLVFKTEALLEYISRFFTLLPGDVILTGTPPGVGVFRKPPQYLKIGDVVEVEIENIGTLKNQVV